MEEVDARWVHLIDSAIARTSSGDAADDAFALWQQLAAQLLSIIGEGGFASLYARSLYLTRAVSAFDWLAPGDASDASEVMFAQLKTSLQGRDPFEASHANRLLLLNFISILASLIGTSLMTGIVRSAWGDDVLHKPAIEKESSND